MDDRIGHLVIEAKLGAGGMGVVYRARDTKLSRDVALKLLPESMARDPDAMARFDREARLLASLNHPNVAAIYGLETDGDKTALVLELVQGRSLSQLLRQEELPTRVALDICCQICAGLEAAHAEGIIHRDLKPSNVMVTPDGRVKLLDFGLARRNEAAINERLPEGDDTAELDAQTRVGTVLGSPGYMSPEQVMGGTAEPRTDLWGFGCILFECLSGERTFDATSTVDAIHAVLYQEIDLSRLPPATTGEIRALIGACLTREIEARPGSARQVRMILEAEIGRPLAMSAIDGSLPTTIAPGLPQHNLPEEITTFVGRVEEASQLRDRLRESRLLTLTGAGGIGKSRLALRLGRWLLSEHTSGTWLIDVGTMTDADALLDSLCDTLNVKGGDDESPLESVARRLQHERVLLLLDNCEHLLTAVVGVVKRLLERCSKLRILITSRESLGVTGEQVHRVRSLSVPAEAGAMDLEELRGFEAVQLFVDRARLCSPELTLNAENAEAVATICRRLDGLPMALEMAAGRCRMLSPTQIVERLGDAFRLLRRDKTATGSARQRTLEAMIAWSYEHLPEEEQELFRKLSVFAGGWDLASATAICADEHTDEFDLLDHLEELVKKSMVFVDERRAGHPRYRLLQTVRQFGLARLEAGTAGAELRDRHCAHYLQLAHSMMNRLYGAERTELLDLLEQEHPNLHQALDHRLGQTDGGPDTVRAATAMALFWHYQSRASAGIAYLTRALEHPASQERNEDRRIGLNYLAYLSTHTRRFAVARKAVDESCDIAAESEDPDLIASSLHYCGQLALHLNNFAEAEEIYTRNLKILRGIGDKRRVAACLQNLGQVKSDQGKHDEARAIYGEALGINRKLGQRAWEAYNIHGIAEVAHHEGDLDEATELFEHALELFREIDEPEHIMQTLYTLGTIAISRGKFEQAQNLQQKALGFVRRAENPHAEAGILRELAEQEMAEDETERARALLGRALDACASTDLTRPDRRVLRCLVSSARLATRISTPAEAEHLRAAAAAVAKVVEEIEGENVLSCQAIDRVDTAWRHPPEPVSKAWERGLGLDAAEAVARARSLLSGSRRPI